MQALMPTRSTLPTMTDASLFDGQDDAPPRHSVDPGFVGRDAASRRRWDLAVAVAARVMDEPPNSKHALFAAQRLYLDPDLPTD